MIILDIRSLLLLPIICYLFTKNWYIVFVALLFCTRFMNSPDRLQEDIKHDCFYSPASGYIKFINTDKEFVTISMFLNIFDNHTQYIPTVSYLKNIEHKHGIFEPAYLEHSVNNERVVNTLYNPTYNFDFTITQITGILTRRILSLQIPNNNKLLYPGERLGFIKLGSRVDISIPTKNIKQILVNPNTHISEMTPLFILKA